MAPLKLLVAGGLWHTIVGVSMAGSTGDLQPTLVVADTPSVSARLYGRVHTHDGARHQGFLRWDRNEAVTADYLDGAKPLPLEWTRQAESLDPEFASRQREARSIVAFGQRISWEVDDQAGEPVTPSAIRFGHLVSLTPLESREARLELWSGEEVRLVGTSTDLGRSMRDLVVESPSGTEAEIEWDDIERVDFLPAPERGRPAARLHGTLTTWDGEERTGYVTWDMDEALVTDVLDGREDGVDHEIDFGEIAAIEWESTRSARVFVHTGEELVLRGTNDVDRDNRGIEVAMPGLGRATVGWEGFRSVRFHPPASDLARASFRPGDSLIGTVYATDGRVIEGAIRWDNEEVAAWETLDGWAGDVELAIEFGLIRSIEKVSDDAVRVTLVDGREVGLEDGEDLGRGNAGIFVQPEGRALRLVRWRDLARVEFSR